MSSGDESAAAGGVSRYEALGGSPFFTALVANFYQRVAADPILRPIYPDADLAEAERRLCLFLEQYWGGPQTYSLERGHPRLRLRHAPYQIDVTARDRWMELMAHAVHEQHLPQDLEDMLWEYLGSAAMAMQNV
ncbi:MAG: globin [Candidatus Nanopelagicales bacterium]|nr:globin [Candidatus Nanopelagicales bacterium]